MHVVAEHDEVTVNYEGRLSTGEIFDSTNDREPLSFRLGDGTVLPAFEQAIVGMTANESKTFTLAAAEAFGPKNEDLIIVFDRGILADKNPAPGMLLRMDLDRDGTDHQVPAMVLAADDETVTLDFNHPLAGHDLTYHIKVLTINPSAPGCGA